MGTQGAILESLRARRKEEINEGFSWEKVLARLNKIINTDIVIELTPTKGKYVDSDVMAAALARYLVGKGQKASYEGYSKIKLYDVWYEVTGYKGKFSVKRCDGMAEHILMKQGKYNRDGTYTYKGRLYVPYNGLYYPQV